MRKHGVSVFGQARVSARGEGGGRCAGCHCRGYALVWVVWGKNNIREGDPHGSRAPVWSPMVPSKASRHPVLTVWVVRGGTRLHVSPGGAEKWAGRGWGKALLEGRGAPPSPPNALPTTLPEGTSTTPIPPPPLFQPPVTAPPTDFTVRQPLCNCSELAPRAPSPSSKLLGWGAAGEGN